MARRVLIYDKDGKERMNTQFTNVKVNQPIDPALFKYTPPEGAKVQDRT
jgi:outer membrane lipoprotein-sorting protein